MRDGIEIYRDPIRREYRDDNAIQPYQTYTYRLRACNSAGCVNSPPVGNVYRSYQYVFHNALKIIYISSRLVFESYLHELYIFLFEIIYYAYLLPLYMTAYDRQNLFFHSIHCLTSFVSNLELYPTFYISKCIQVSVATLQAMPEQVAPPSVSAVSSTSLYLTWVPPGRPNGIITNYDLVSLTEGKVTSLSGDTSSYLLSGEGTLMSS